MTGNALASMEDLDGHRGVADIELTMHQSIGNAVVVPFDLDVIVDVDARLFPFGERVGFGGQRTQRRPIELSKRWRGCLPVCETGDG